MNWTFLSLLLGAAAVAIAHSVLPDHWVPLAVLARTQRWSIWRVARLSALASVGHIITSLVLAGVIALVGLQFQEQIATQQGQIVGIVLILTGLGFLIWGLLSPGHHGHSHSGHSHVKDHTHHIHDYDGQHSHHHEPHHKQEITADGNDCLGIEPLHHGESGVSPSNSEEAQQKQKGEQNLAQRLAAIAIPFGVAASPDLTILPVAFAASAVGIGAVVSVLTVFSALTLGTFVGLSVLATLAGYQIKGLWLERHANTLTSLVLIILGIVAFIGF